MAAPIAVAVPLVVSDEMVCILDALANPVVATPCLDWTPVPAAAGGKIRKSRCQPLPNGAGVFEALWIGPVAH